MSLPKQSKPARKRVGRKRQPPLAPGPALQFVVASHPDHFKDENTMRHVRSHVMYKHREEQLGVSPAERSKSIERSLGSTEASRTPSPMTVNSDGALEYTFNMPPASQRRDTIWDGAFYQSPSNDPMRNLAARIIAATTAGPARSTPSTFEKESEYPFPTSNDIISEFESLEDLRNQYINSSNNFGKDDPSTRKWVKMLCSNRMSFLSQISVACVYQDVADGFLVDTALTVYAKTKLMGMITESLNTHTDDFTILSILNLLVSEIGGPNEDVFDVHQEGLVRIVQQRGGIANLAVGDNIATFLIVVLLSFTVLRGRSEPAMLQGFTPNTLHNGVRSPSPVLPSPLYAPNDDLSRLYGNCSNETFEIIRDMYDLTRTFTSRWSYSPPEDTLAESRLEQIYTRLLYRPSTEDDATPDWIYESCRLAAIIYCRSIVQGMPLAQSADIMHAGTSNSGGTTTVISALHHAVEQTDQSSHWGDLGGVLLWVYLVGGAASWPSFQPAFQPAYGGADNGHSSMAWTRKCFALYAVRSSLSINFDCADAIVESQRMMLQVQHMIELRREDPQ